MSSQARIIAKQKQRQMLGQNQYDILCAIANLFHVLNELSFDVSTNNRCLPFFHLNRFHC